MYQLTRDMPVEFDTCQAWVDMVMAHLKADRRLAQSVEADRARLCDAETP
jgi:hypothetical protein